MVFFLEWLLKSDCSFLECSVSVKFMGYFDSVLFIEVLCCNVIRVEKYFARTERFPQFFAFEIIFTSSMTNTRTFSTTPADGNPNNP